jgi:diadenylate cyclase
MEFLKPGIIDFIDIIVVTFIFYKLFLLVKGTRAVQMFLGLALIIIFSIAAQILGLKGLQSIIQSITTVWVVAFVIIFQPELRRALASLGENRIFSKFVSIEPAETLDEIIKAAEKLTQLEFGAILVLEKDVGLKNVVDTGTSISAKVSSELITTIFTPHTPLHDGAVIIRGDRIVAAGCILPLTQNPVHDHSLGTRHRAAIGLSEETDAGVIVVSEETQRISFARRGILTQGISLEDLRAEILNYFEQHWKEEAGAR